VSSHRQRVLWLINKVPPAAVRSNAAVGVRGGWLDSYIEVFGPSDDFELHVAYPSALTSIDECVVDNVHYWGLPSGWEASPLTRILRRWRHEVINPRTIAAVREVVDTVAPDLVHLHGATVSPYSVRTFRSWSPCRARRPRSSRSTFVGLTGTTWRSSLRMISYGGWGRCIITYFWSRVRGPSAES
jgi:hypothetical protein